LRWAASPLRPGASSGSAGRCALLAGDVEGPRELRGGSVLVCPRRNDG
jgi:hypothetical protein